jgi:hypothetical protein
MAFVKDFNSLSASQQAVMTANGKSQGMTGAEYLASRGGINTVTNKYGDSYTEGLDLTDAEYQEALAKGGVTALNEAITAKQDTYNKKNNPSNVVNPASGTTGAVTPTLTAAQQAGQVNAITALTATFNAMGLGGDIANAITDMVQKGYTTDTIMMIAQDPTSKDPVALAFQKRFPANADRIKAGLAPLSPADYMLNEKAYRAAMQQAGLPKGFYDSQQDFTKFIANDVSPSELQSRINTAADAIANADPFYTSSLKAMYGLTTGDMIAHALDPQAALPLLQKQAEALKIGTAAARQGWGISATGAENLYTQGVTAAQAAQGFKTVAGMQTDQQRLAEIWGGDAAAQGQNLVAATFGTAGAAYADQQIKALQQKEINAFTGGSGVAKGSLGVSTEQTGGNL